MGRYVALLVLLLNSALLAGNANAAERVGPIRIGALTHSWGPTPPVVGLRDGLVELGYRENEDFVIGVRFTQGDIGALPAAARELLEFGVDIIFSTGFNSAKAAQTATTKIPIVFAAAMGDPVQLGLIRSYAQPGGNMTGVTDLDLELGPKRLEIFKEMIPGLRRVLFPYPSADPYAALVVKAYRGAARRLGIVLVEKTIRTQDEARATVAAVRREEVDGILAPSLPALNIPGFILEAATERAIPAMFAAAFWVERGGLVSYGPNLYESGRQAARLVDKIVKGGNPARIPVEANPKIELAINTKAAKTLGLTIPPYMLYRADRLIQ